MITGEESFSLLLSTDHIRPTRNWEMKRFLLLSLISPALLAQEKIDAVAEGKNTFDTMGCMECHTTTASDDSIKTGPTLYGLFLNEARDRKVVAEGETEHITVKADRGYFDRSVRQSWDQLAVAESGPTKGTAYLPAMPMYPIFASITARLRG